MGIYGFFVEPLSSEFGVGVAMLNVGPVALLLVPAILGSLDRQNGGPAADSKHPSCRRYSGDAISDGDQPCANAVVSGLGVFVIFTWADACMGRLSSMALW